MASPVVDLLPSCSDVNKASNIKAKAKAEVKNFGLKAEAKAKD
jgi:hypothetical protein